MSEKKIADIVLPEGYRPEDDPNYMSPNQRAYFRQLLIDWREQLVSEAEKTIHVMHEERAAFADPSDRATLETNRNFELRTRDRGRKLVAKINRTIEKIEWDDYGYCDDCGVEIGLRRLKVRPVTNLCIDCKTRSERKEKALKDQ
ncbi:RNA polymerase-binding protein DksA [Magnetococcales bacterium HHB-1]